jgi:hypothetical protein
LECGLLAFFDEDALVVGGGHGELDGFVMPSGEEDGVGEFDAADAFFCQGEQFLVLRNGVGEVLQDLDVLAADLIEMDIHVPAFGHGEGGIGLHAEFDHGLAVAPEVDTGAVGDGEAALLFEAVRQHR